MKRPRVAVVRTILASLSLIDAACGARPQATAPASVAVLPQPRTAPPMSSASAPEEAPRALAGKLESVQLFDDGTLGIATDREVVTLDRAGKERRAEIPPGMTAFFGREGVHLEGAGHATLWSTPSLETLWTGETFIDVEPMDERSRFAFVGARLPAASILFQLRSRLVRLAVPFHDASRGAEITVLVDEDARRAVVQWRAHPGPNGAALMDIETGSRLKDVPFAFVSNIVGDTLYGVARGELVATDLASAAPPRRVKVPCKSTGDSYLGPTSAESIVVMCPSEALLLDARALMLRRSLGSLVLPCDHNTIGVPFFEERTRGDLVIEACHAQVRIDPRAGTFRCSDRPDLLPVPRTPDVARCSPAGAPPTERIPGGATLVSPPTGPWTVRGAKFEVAVESGAEGPVVARDASRLVYRHAGAVILRGLPDGKLVARYAYASSR